MPRIRYIDLIKEYPQLAKEWNADKNAGLDPSNLHGVTDKKIWWKCKAGHEWQATFSNRAKRGSNCPYCAGRIPVIGENDLNSLYPDIAKEWCYERNKNLVPEDFMPYSEKKVWWRCKNGHQYQAWISGRVKGSGCPFCSGQKAVAGVSDLGTLYPHLAKEWNTARNAQLHPSRFRPGSQRKVWWVCEKGHEWAAIISSRALNGNGCPYCSQKLPVIGENDLATVNPSLVKEWNYQKNGNISPQMFLPHSEKKVWWIGSCGHEWQASISHRSNGRGCPVCKKEQQTSFPEQAILFYLKDIFSDVENSNREMLNGKEIDIYLPSIKTAIEYDGQGWHKNAIKDLEKSRLLKEMGIRFIRIREPNLPAIDIDEVIYREDVHSDKSLDASIRELFSLLGLNGKIPDVDTARDRIAILDGYISKKRLHSLQSQYPSIAMEWAYHKNRSIRPDMVSPSSGRKYWWVCKKGHEWLAGVNTRVRGSGCPVCTGRRVEIGFNDLATTCPALVKEWHYEKNGSLSPRDVTSGSQRKVWWRCSLGHVWQASIANRVKSTGCPVCCNKRIVPGINDLATFRPEIAEEWDKKKNETSPSQIAPKSNRMVWWLCDRGHEWKATPNARVSGHGCPYCSGRFPIVGENDLQTTHPQIAGEWNYEKNGELTPLMVKKNSHHKVWWKCSKGHVWQSIVSNRTKGTQCPVCKKVK